MKRCLPLLSALCWLPLANGAWGDSPGPAQSSWQAYPPSCLAYPLPSPSGAAWSASVPLETDNPGADHHETVDFVFWRSPCANGKSALLGKMSRDPGSVNKNPAPVFAGLRVSQGAVQNHPARVALEPNTVISYVPSGSSVSNSLLFVFENDASATVDYSQAITVSINATESTVDVAIPAYDESQYPNAASPLQLSGYVTGNWYDPAHGGEGAQVEVGAGSGDSRYITFAWYTYDKAGIPFWLFGQGGFNAGDRSATLTVAYATGGGFAGGPSASVAIWGTLTVDFPDCNSMHFTYQANAGLPDGIPQGSGSRDWTRLTGINGLSCL